MEFRIYDYLPPEAMALRVTVFVDEQGFVDEPDGTDKVAVHIVCYKEGIAIAVCRVFKEANSRNYILGRFAVQKEQRGKGIGRLLLSKAEEYAESAGAEALKLHSQYHAKDFYKKCGYIIKGEVEYEQGEPHIWLEKKFES